MTTLADWIAFNPVVNLEKGKSYPFIGMDVVTPGYRYVSQSQEKIYAGGGAKFRAGDTLFARITPCLQNGKIAQFLHELPDSPGFGSTEFFIFRAIEEKSDPAFVYYLSQTNILKETAINSMVGASGRQRADVKVLRELEISAPPVKIQQRIAQILSSYDDLIENNRRRVDLLEESIRLLYREWFVSLRFPGYQSILGSDGVPRGWIRKPLTELVEINPQTTFDKNRIYPFVPMQALSESSMIIEGIEDRAISGGAKFQNQDTLLARITPCLENGKTGFVQFLDEDNPVASGSTEFIVLRSATVSPYWVYCTARDAGFREHAIGSMVGSDGRQRVNPKCFDSYLAWQPTQNVLAEFNKAVEPMFKEIQTLSSMSKRLREARDALLPKLIFGEIQV